ncbi:flavin reductase family protein [Oxalobacter aliiformigenes]|uniref:Flavin reductase family protein n=1 Tax=Oxalobacter aliiformigenes TaxID=2946593 RepID=A0ABY7JG17_9BURK|nr:flavin reductase family protein [Oxalobacter aliiformigenes]WAV92707.1 flavin reductase family protein [Oxalobacter aliiformigenes]WAV95787.1 flavin reductase family protein [Oxalobacter aliiformigenes]WAV96421.1 flavin reductase family protein [Oxalobacter aliiformigenes]
MSEFRPVPLEYATRLINHGPTIMVTSRCKDGRQRNVMTAAWSTLVEFDPPRLVVVINKEAYTRTLLEESGVFAVCVPAASFIDQVYAVGSVSGRGMDKFSRFNIRTVQSTGLDIPVIEEGCVAWLECRLLPEPGPQERYDTCFGEVVSAAADQRIFRDGLWNFTDQNRELHTIHHLGGGNFVLSGEMIHARQI